MNRHMTVYVEGLAYGVECTLGKNGAVALTLPRPDELPDRPPDERPVWAEIADRADRRMEILGYEKVGSWEEGWAIFTQKHRCATYSDLLAMWPNDTLHLRALISARGAELEHNVDAEFLDVLSEEGYEEV